MNHFILIGLVFTIIVFLVIYYYPKYGNSTISEGLIEGRKGISIPKPKPINIPKPAPIKIPPVKIQPVDPKKIVETLKKIGEAVVKIAMNALEAKAQFINDCLDLMINAIKDKRPIKPKEVLDVLINRIKKGGPLGILKSLSLPSWPEIMIAFAMRFGKEMAKIAEKDNEKKKEQQQKKQTTISTPASVMPKSFDNSKKGDLSESGISTRYIRFEYNHKDCLNLAEIEVFSPNGQNLITPNTVVTKSSGYNGDSYPGKNFVDGNRNNFVHTSCGDVPWIEVDLGTSQLVSVVRIINRKDCCQSRILGSRLKILDDKRNTLYVSSPITETKLEYSWLIPSHASNIRNAVNSLPQPTKQTPNEIKKNAMKAVMAMPLPAAVIGKAALSMKDKKEVAKKLMDPKVPLSEKKKIVKQVNTKIRNHAVKQAQALTHIQIVKKISDPNVPKETKKYVLEKIKQIPKIPAMFSHKKALNDANKQVVNSPPVTLQNLSVNISKAVNNVIQSNSVPGLTAEEKEKRNKELNAIATKTFPTREQKRYNLDQFKKELVQNDKSIGTTVKQIKSIKAVDPVNSNSYKDYYKWHENWLPTYDQVKI